MKLSQIVRQYRKLNKMSMDALAERSGLSKSYISMIENENNPHTGKAVVPTINSLKKLATGMDMDIDELLARMGDEPVSIRKSSPGLSQEEKYVLSLYTQLNSVGKSKVIDYMNDLLITDFYTKDTSSQDA